MFESATDPAGTDGRVWIRDRCAGTSTPTAERRSAAPGISGNGCVVAFSVPGAGTAATERLARGGRPLCGVERLQPSRPPSRSTPWCPAERSLRRRCRSTARRSCGRPARRSDDTCGRLTQAAYVRTASFDSALTASAGVGDGGRRRRVRRRGDRGLRGRTRLDTLRPGTRATSTSGAHRVVHRSSTIELHVPDRSTGRPVRQRPGRRRSRRTGRSLVFGSTSTDLAAVGADPVVTPFVVSVDRTTRATKVLIGDARRPVVSGDGLPRRLRARNRRPSCCRRRRVASFSTSTDRPIDGLDTAGPASRVAMSRFGRWVVFDSGDGTSFTDVRRSSRRVSWCGQPTCAWPPTARSPTRPRRPRRAHHDAHHDRPPTVTRPRRPRPPFPELSAGRLRW